MKIELDAKTITDVFLNFLSGRQVPDNKKTDDKKTDDYDFFVGKKVIVRHHMSGVSFGTVKAINDKNIILENSRKLWSWTLENCGVTRRCGKKGATFKYRKIKSFGLC